MNLKDLKDLKMENKKIKELIDSGDYIDSADIAMDEDCPSNILEELSNDKDDIARMNVASNKNTTPETLIKLSQDSIYEVKYGVSANPNTPLEALLNMKNDSQYDIKENIIKHSNMTLKALQDNFIYSGVTDKMELAAQSELCAYDDFIFLSEAEDNDNEEIKNALARNKKTPTHLLKSFIENRVGSVKQILLQESHCPSTILDMLFEELYEKDVYLGSGDSYYARRERAKSLETSTKELEKLSEDKVENVRAEVAKNLNTPVELLKKLILDEDYTVRAGVVDNPNTPVEILKQLAQNETSNYVKEKLETVLNPQAPTVSSEKLFEDDGSLIIPENETTFLQESLQEIAKHPNASGLLLDKIYKKHEISHHWFEHHNNIFFSTLLEIKNDMKKKLEILDTNSISYEMLNKDLENIQLRIYKGFIEAKDESTPPQRLDELSLLKDNDLLIAKNPNTSLETLTEIAKDDIWRINFHIINHKNVTLELIHDIVKDNKQRELYIDFFTAINSKTSYEEAMSIAKKHIGKDPVFDNMAFLKINIPSEVLEKKYQALNEEQKYYLVSGKRASLKTLELLAKENKYFFKEYVYNHPNCSQELKEKLHVEIKALREQRLIAIQKEEEKYEANTEYRKEIMDLFSKE